MVRGGEGGHYVSLSGNRVWSETWWESKLEKVVKEKVAERNKGSVYHSTFSGRDTPRLSRRAPPPSPPFSLILLTRGWRVSLILFMFS